MKDDTHLKNKGQILNVPQVPVNICNECGMLENLKDVHVEDVDMRKIIGRNTRSWMTNQATASRRSAKARLLMPMLGMVWRSLSRMVTVITKLLVKMITTSRMVCRIK